MEKKCVVITGASQGLGREVALQLADRGARVILIARSEKLLAQVSDMIVAKGGSALYYACDLRDLDQVRRVVEDILRTQKQIDVLVNNAGVWTDNDLEKKRPQLRQQALETNVLGNIQVTEGFLPYFLKRKRGHIVNVVSTSGVESVSSGNNGMWRTYGASKWAMRGYTKALHESVAGTRIKISGFFPGGFESNLYENAGRDNPHNTPWMMQTADVARAIVFAIEQPEDVNVESLVLTKIAG